LNLIEKLKNEINFLSEFSRLKKAISKEWYVQLSKEKSVKTTINIKKENIISAGRISPNILVSYLSKISWCFCLSTSKFYPTVYYFFIELWDIIKIFY
jgi:hypothetical protein